MPETSPGPLALMVCDADPSMQKLSGRRQERGSVPFHEIRVDGTAEHPVSTGVLREGGGVEFARCVASITPDSWGVG